MVVDEVDRDAEGYCCWIYESSMLRVVAAVDNTKGLPMDNSCTLDFFLFFYFCYRSFSSPYTNLAS